MATLLLGAFFAIFQHDLKGLLAYSTISHLGLITMLAGLGTPLAMVAAIFHIINHATFKASLFMAAGIIDHETGTRDMRRLCGLRRSMPYHRAPWPWSPAAAMAGVPLLNGFLSKEMFFAEAVEARQGHAPRPATCCVAAPGQHLRGRLFAALHPPGVLRAAADGPAAQAARAAGLDAVPGGDPGVACLVVGIVPAATVGPFLDVAARSVLGPATPDTASRLWHGFNAPLLMSVVGLAGGIASTCILSAGSSSGPEGPPVLRRPRGPAHLRAELVVLWWRWPRALDRLLGTERLQPSCALVLVALWRSAGWRGRRPPAAASAWATELDPVFALAWLVGAACARRRRLAGQVPPLAALVLLGGAGLVTCVTFVWFSAPDLALTQLWSRSSPPSSCCSACAGCRSAPRRSPATSSCPRACAAASTW